MTSEPEKLLPCPFCGSTNVDMIASNGAPDSSPLGGGTRHVECDDCFACGPAEPSPRDGRAWNTRLSSPVSGTDMVMVPREPTEAMISAGERAAWDDHNSMPAIRAMPLAWSAMLAAAPASPTPPIPMIAEAGEREWPVKWSGDLTVGNMIANLRTMPADMPIHAAYHVVQSGERPARLFVKHPTVSKERVAGREIHTGDESVPYSAVIWSHEREPTTPATLDNTAATEPCGYCGDSPCVCDATDLCQVPGCRNRTDAGVCPSCDDWVTAEAAALDQTAVERQLRTALQEAHDTLHECTAVLHADDCRKVAAVMARCRATLTAKTEKAE